MPPVADSVSIYCCADGYHPVTLAAAWREEEVSSPGANITRSLTVNFLTLRATRRCAEDLADDAGIY